jgi:hypothetical protein
MELSLLGEPQAVLLVKNIPTFYGNQRFLMVITKALILSL